MIITVFGVSIQYVTLGTVQKKRPSHENLTTFLVRTASTLPPLSVRIHNFRKGGLAPQSKC